MPVTTESPVKAAIPQSFASLRSPREEKAPIQRKEQVEYNPADHVQDKEKPAVESALIEALRKRAGEPKVEASPVETKPAEEAPATEAPAPTKFVAADDPQADAMAKPVDPAADSSKPPPKAAQLREAYDKLKEDFSKAAAEGELTKKELASFRSKATEYESQIKALEPLKPRIEEYEKKLAEYDEKLRIVDYIHHPEFHESYVKPLAEAVKNAHAVVKEMVVENPDGTRRLGNEQDFSAILAAPNRTEAHRIAKELFGELGQSVVGFKDQVNIAQRRREAALQESSLKSQEWAKAAAERQHAEATRFRETFQRTKDELAEKYAPIYKPDLNDKEIADTYQRGVEIVNAVMERDPSASNESFVQDLARVYHRAATNPVLLLKNQRLQLKIEMLESKLSKFEKSEPSSEGRKESNGNVELHESADPRIELRKRIEAVANRKP